MAESSGARGAAGHFTNETNRHSEMFSSRNDGSYREGLYLYNQQVPYTGEDRPTVALPVNTVFGQARLVEVEPRTIDAEAEGDGSVSLPYIQQNGSSSGQRQHSSQAVAATQLLDTASPVDPAVHQQPVSSPLGVTRQEQGPSLPIEILQGDLTYHAQSCSGLSDVNINCLAPQLQELPSDDSSAVRLNREENLGGACAQQTLCMVSDDHVEPMNTQSQQAILTGLIGNKAFQDSWMKCYASFKRANFDEQTAKAYANQHLHCRNNGSIVECLRCGCTGNITNSLIHGQQCPVLNSLQEVQNNGNVRSASDVRQLGACGTNARGNEMLAQTTRKKPEGDTAIPAPYPLQVSEATADSQSDIVFPPSQNQNLVTSIQTLPNTAGRDEEYVRAECAGTLATEQQQTEARMTRNEGNASVGSMRASISFQNDSVSHTSSLYRTAPAASRSQGGGDRNPDHRRARHPEYADFQARFGTYGNFPTTVNQHVQSLAEAGLFYTGKKDACKCFHCGGEIHSWSKDDKPWFEHARYFAHCDFVIQQKGQEYINAIQHAFRVAGIESQVQDSVARSQDFGDTDAVVREMENMGYSRHQIVNAVEEYKRRVQAGIISKGADKMNAVLDILLEESDLTKGHQSPTSAIGHQNSSSGNGTKRFDYLLCCACKSGKASISQQECGHVVCRGCAPPRYDQKELPLCRFCRREVVGTYLIDTSLM